MPEENRKRNELLFELTDLIPALITLRATLTPDKKNFIISPRDNHPIEIPVTRMVVLLEHEIEAKTILMEAEFEMVAKAKELLSKIKGQPKQSDGSVDKTPTNLYKIRYWVPSISEQGGGIFRRVMLTNEKHFSQEEFETLINKVRGSSEVIRKTINNLKNDHGFKEVTFATKWDV